MAVAAVRRAERNSGESFEKLATDGGRTLFLKKVVEKAIQTTKEKYFK